MEKLIREMEKLTREQVIAKLEKGDKDFKGLDLSELDLSGLDLSKCTLRYAYLPNCNLSNCNLFNSDLYKTTLFYSNLSYTNLSKCELFNSDLSSTNLENADLSNSNLSYVDLSEADLSNSNLENAKLSNANLYCANLNNARLEKAELGYANLGQVKLDEKEEIRTGIILEEPMIGYKKCKLGTIVTLEIPKGAIVFSINNKQCRTNKAKVIDISDGKKIAYSNYNNFFMYELGKEIEVKDFDLRYNVECSTGIHFFRTREEAENY